MEVQDAEIRRRIREIAERLVLAPGETIPSGASPEGAP
jgi:hypothetical protein